ncbi:MAG: hypothetical protein E6789_05610 [Clostridium baratii]|nr:hypothetical protein [Clostridium baratii]
MKNIILVNGSPKGKKSCSNYLLETIKENIEKDNIVSELIINDNRIKREEKFNILVNSDVIIIAFPLYVDCLPSCVISFLQEFENYLNNKKIEKEIILYGIVNCGFFEGEQNKYALKVLKNYTNHISFLTYGGGLGIGGGAFLGGSQSIPWQAKIRSDGKKNLDILCEAIDKKIILKDNVYTNISMNKKLYSMAGSFGWISEGIKNKIFIKGLFNRPYNKELD